MSLWAIKTGIKKILLASFWPLSFKTNSEFPLNVSLTRTSATTFREPKQFYWTSLWRNPIKLEPYAYNWMVIKVCHQFNMKCNRGKQKRKRKKKYNQQNAEEKDLSLLIEIQIILRSYPCLRRSITWDDQG